MKKLNMLVSLVITGVMIISQVAAVFAAPAIEDVDLIAGTVQAITLKIDPNTGVITVLVDLLDENGESLTVRIGQETAMELGLVVLDADGNLILNEDALEQEIEIDPADVLPDEEARHPVGSALAIFFADVPGLDYDAIMSAHEDGSGFGLIAQALWLTRKFGGDAEEFALILQAKKDRDYSNFVFEDGTSPTNWGQFRKALLGEDKKGNLGMVMSNKDAGDDSNSTGNGDNANHGNNGNDDNRGNKDKDKGKDKNNNGNDNGNGKKP
jgi:hypothetical protein